MLRSMPTNRKGYLAEYRNRMRKQGLCSVCCKPNDKTKGLCRECTDKRNRYFKTDIPKQKRAVNRNVYRRRLRLKVIHGYGAICTCCGETNLGFLTLDHINNDGNIERQGKSSPSHKFYTKLISEGFPDRIEVRCYNCNLGRAKNGGICPHKG